nr:prepilin-type N-terminal cleavage/methylation domain-containing protein [Deltaproteobacteria bacterium]
MDMVCTTISGRRDGITLIELMTVIALIGLLAGLIIGGFISYQTEKKQALVQAHLENIRLAQISYREAHGVFASRLEDLAVISSGPSRYSYHLVTSGLDRFSVQASGNIDSDSTLDVWEITEKGILTHVVDDAQD